MTDRITQTVGLDVGDREIEFAVLEGDVEDLSDFGKFSATRAGVERFFGGVAPSRVFLEAGGHSRWLEALIGGLGHEVTVIDPRRLPLISKSLQKTDRRDAELLARLGRADPKLLNRIQHRSAQGQADLAVLRARQNLVQARTSLICAVRSQVKLFGERLPSCDARAFARRVHPAIPELLQDALLPVLASIEVLTQKIRQMDDLVEDLCGQYPETKGLRRVKGAGPITTLAFVLTIEDPSRFRKSRDVGAYLGLVPRRFDSGARQQQLGITKAGDKYLRHMLVQASHYILGPRGEDSDLRRVGERIAARGGKNAKKRAVIAVARKLAVLFHALWVSGEAYAPLRNAGRAEAA